MNTIELVWHLEPCPASVVVRCGLLSWTRLGEARAERIRLSSDSVKNGDFGMRCFSSGRVARPGQA